MHSYFTVMTDHPAWVPDGTLLVRVFPSPDDKHAIARTEGSSLDWCCSEASGLGPETFSLPGSAAQTLPELRDALAALGPVARFRNPSLWDALGTAIIRQVVRAAQAQLQYRAFCTAFGDQVQCGQMMAWLFPSPEVVLKLDDAHFADVGLTFKRHALRAAASAFLVHGDAWTRMPSAELVAELCMVPRVGPWTAGAAIADWSNNFAAYPCGDLAVRTWAAHAAPAVSWPDKEPAFQQYWQEHSGPHLAELTLLTLAWGGRHARTQLSVATVARLVNTASPRWAGFNLLAPTYEVSAAIVSALDPAIKIMVGGHQAKAMPSLILADPRMHRCEALIIGEAEARATELLGDHDRRAELPGVMWHDQATGTIKTGRHANGARYLAPDINALPFVNRAYLAQDPHRENGRLEANMVGARGCPYNCSFCGAAVSANPDITIRTRNPSNIIAEMGQLRASGVTAFRFVDDLFLGARRVIDPMMAAFTAENIGRWAQWDATGRINVLNRIDDQALDLMAANGLREVALGIESGSERMLTLIDKRITPDMARNVVRRLTSRGINVKGYFILGFPPETPDEIDATVRLLRDLWDITDPMPGRFRASAFEYRPYPGTPDWDRLLATGCYTAQQLTNYTAVDLTGDGLDEAMRERDEFNFSVNLQLSDAPVSYVRRNLVVISREQWTRTHGAAA